MPGQQQSWWCACMELWCKAKPNQHHQLLTELRGARENTLHPLCFVIMERQGGRTWLLSCTFYPRPSHLTVKNGWAARLLCLSTAVAQHCSAFISFCRTVRGPLDHGDAQRVQQQQLGRPHRHLHHLRGICSADGSHLACHGGPLRLSARLASALVGGAAFWRFSRSCLWEGSGCGNWWSHQRVLDVLH